METCNHCKIEEATVEDKCADCFWEEDSKRKQKKREDPKWRENRMQSFIEVVWTQIKELKKAD